MNENLKAFLIKAGEDEPWRAEMAKIEDRQAAIDACLAKAAELGFGLTAEDFDVSDDALSDDELVAVAGAGYCACAIGGGGTDTVDNYETCISCGFDERPCACVFYGEGWMNERYTGDGDVTYKEVQRCMCPAVGQGDSYE